VAYTPPVWHSMPLGVRRGPSHCSWAGTGSPSTLDGDVLRLPPDFPGGFIKSQTEECGMSQAVLGRPFYESDLGHEPRLRPVHLAHLIHRDAPAPSPDISVRKIGEWAVLNLQWFQLAQNLAANVRDEARSDLSGEA